MDATKSDSVTDQAGKIKSKKLDEAKGTVIQVLLSPKSIWLIKLSCGSTYVRGSFCVVFNHNCKSGIRHDPKRQEIDSKNHVIILKLLLLLGVTAKNIRSCWYWRSVTPRNIVEVAHWVNLHDIHKSWQQKQVACETYQIAVRVENEVKRS